MPRAIITVFIIAVLSLPLATDVTAQWNSAIGTQVDFVGGGSNFHFDGASFGQGFNYKQSTSFYAAYPSVQFRSRRAHSNFELQYAFGLNRVNSNLDFDSESHTASARFSSSLRRWDFSLSDSFELTPDFATFNAMRGIVPSSEGFAFLYAPVATRHSSRTNSATADGAYKISEKSALSVELSHTQRDYDDSAVLFGGLSDQYRVAANVTYTRRKNERSSWGIGYATAYYDFKNFYGAYSHGVNAVYSRRLSPTVTLDVTAGPSYVDFQGPNGKSIGYNATARLDKRLTSSAISFRFARNNGESSGYGSVSATWQAGVGVQRPLGRRTTASADFSIYDSLGEHGGSYRVRGGSAIASVNLALLKTLSLNWGGEYQRYDQTSVFRFKETRFFFSVRFRAPELWLLSR